MNAERIAVSLLTIYNLTDYTNFYYKKNFMNKKRDNSVFE